MYVSKTQEQAEILREIVQAVSGDVIQARKELERYQKSRSNTDGFDMTHWYLSGKYAALQRRHHELYVAWISIQEGGLS